MMKAERNAPPEAGWAKIVTELHVADLDVSLAFWKEILGFEIAYRREAEKFVYLEHPEGQTNHALPTSRSVRDRADAATPRARRDVPDLLRRNQLASDEAQYPRLADLPRPTRSLAQNR
jgi:catechol 2,3-dioxygenase-like lactoylglutathione lyase family enzyme